MLTPRVHFQEAVKINVPDTVLTVTPTDSPTQGVIGVDRRIARKTPLRFQAVRPVVNDVENFQVGPGLREVFEHERLAGASARLDLAEPSVEPDDGVLLAC